MSHPKPATTTEQPLLHEHPSQSPPRLSVQHSRQPSQSVSAVKRKPVPVSSPLNEGPNEKETPPRKGHAQHISSLTTTLRWWIPDILASLMAVISLLAIVVILDVYDGHTLDSLSLPHSLSLNALVAILATLNRMFLTVPLASCISQEGWLLFVSRRRRACRLQDLATYNDASNGAWGSLLLLFKSPQHMLGVSAALVTIMSLGISTFVQQLIVLQDAVITHPSSEFQPGNVSRATRYDEYVGAPGQGGPTATTLMNAGIYAGMFGFDSTPKQPDCRSGNCTWPLVPSLGVCGGCAPTSPINTYCTDRLCNYTLPSGNVFSFPKFVDDSGAPLTYEATAWLSYSASNGGKTFNSSSGDRYYVANWEQMGAPAGSRSPGTDVHKYLATECALWMCVNTYNVTVQFAKVNEELVSSYDRPDIVVEGGWIWGRGHTGNEEYTITVPDTSSIAAGKNESIVYTITIFAGEGIAYRLSDLVDDNSGQLNDRGWLASTDIALAMWDAAGSASWMENLASSMSLVVRGQTTDAVSHEEFTGTAYSTGVKIVWWWIVFPAVAVMLAIVLLIVTMIRTHRSDINAWKGSPLIFLFCEIDEDVRVDADIASCFNKVNGTDKVQKQRVRLRLTDEQRWTFERS